MPQRGDTPRLLQILRATKCEKLSESPRLTYRPSQGQKGLKERAIMASQRPSFKGEVFYKHLIIIDFFAYLIRASPVSHAAFGMALTGTGTSSSNGGTTGQGSGTKRPCGMDA